METFELYDAIKTLDERGKKLYPPYWLRYVNPTRYNRLKALNMQCHQRQALLRLRLSLEVAQFCYMVAKGMMRYSKEFEARFKPRARRFKAGGYHSSSEKII